MRNEFAVLFNITAKSFLHKYHSWLLLKMYQPDTILFYKNVEFVEYV